MFKAELKASIKNTMLVGGSISAIIALIFATKNHDYGSSWTESIEFGLFILMIGVLMTLVYMAISIVKQIAVHNIQKDKELEERNLTPWEKANAKYKRDHPDKF